MSFTDPIILGVVEGLTEFIPVSSTGHLILTEALLGAGERQKAVLDVVIQVGAILAICWLYRAKLWSVATGMWSGTTERRFVGNVLLAFIPALVVGAMVHDFVKRVLFSPWIVAVSLIVGGIAILVVERMAKTRTPAHSVEELSAKLAVGVGICQLLSLVPGVSRSGATIMGGVALGIDRKTATEFSFFLAIPTMFGAAALDLFENGAMLSIDDAAAIGIGLITSFLVAMLVVRWLVNFVARHGFGIFGWYRILTGTAALAILSFA